MSVEKIRQLAAIMFTDVVGYSRLAQSNEVQALGIIKIYQQLLRSVVRKYDGDEIKTIGDGFLFKFPSAVEAVRCAAEIQKVVVEHNASAHRENRFRVRVGVHLGDVIHRNNDIYGDGVNIASRIQSVAEPGEVYISRQVYDQIQNKVSESVERLGPKKLRNIKTPVEVYRLILRWQEPKRAPGKLISFLMSRRFRWAGSLALLLIATASTLWFARQSPSEGVNSNSSSLAVLPFKNLSDSKDDEYFSDGVAEDITARFSKFGGLRVISFSSMMRYKAVEKNLKEIGSELAVSAVLLGSTQRYGDRILVRAKLVDARTDDYMWAESYDGELRDVFDIQSDIVEKVLIALRAKVSPSEKARMAVKSTDSLEAYKYYLKGKDYFRSNKRRDNENAIEMFKRAVTIDSNFALAYVGLAHGYCERVKRFGFQPEWLDSSVAVATKALSLDSSLSEAHTSLASVYNIKEWYADALTASVSAVHLDPNNADALEDAAWANMSTGHYEDALVGISRALAVRPYDGRLEYNLGEVYRRIGNYPKAEQSFNKALSYRNDLLDAHYGLGFVRLTHGRDEKTMSSESILSISPDDARGFVVAGFKELLAGNFVRAEELYRTAVSMKSGMRNPYNGRCLTTELGYIYTKNGQPEKAEEQLIKSWQLNERKISEGSQGYGIPFDMMTIHAIRGEITEAGSWLQKAVDAGWRDYQFALVDPTLENLREDQKFKQVISQLKNQMIILDEHLVEMRME
jgi:adenylate cyclase